MHDGMRVDAVEVRVVALPMVGPFVAAHGAVDRRTLVVVRLAGPDGEGWGECAALPDPTYTSEFVDGARSVIATELAPRLLALDRPVTSTDLPVVLADVVGNHMARAALELALLDAECRHRGQRLVDRLTPTPPAPRTTVPAGVALGLHDSPAALADEVRARVDEGYRRLKLKIAPGHDVDHVAAARRAAGPDIVLLADANGAYRWDAAPGAPDDARGLVALDESLTSPVAVRQALDMGAASVVCVKAPMLGSWLAAADVLDMCSGLGIDAYVGGMLDGGIGRAATIALAAHPGATLAGDISATARFFTDDVCRPVEVLDGTVAVPTTIGVEVDADALSRCTIRLDTIRR